MGFKELISVIDKDRKLYVQMHRPPDPDCLASASVLSDMLQSVGFNPQIVYTGLISKPETMELIDNLGIKLIRLDTESNKQLIRAEDQIIVVDCQKENSNVARLPGEYIACIDHHPALADASYPYADIRPEYGACSSLIYEYAADFGYEISPVQAALMIYGIRIDTDDLSRRKYLMDIDIFSALYKIANLDILSSIGRNAIRPEDISTTIIAYENLTIKNNVAYSFAGDDKAKESLAELADKLISLADVSFVVVYSKCFNGYNFSIRSQINALHAGKIAKYAFSKVNGDGGGHMFMAGGLIPKVTFMDLLGGRAVMERVISIIEDAIENVNNEANGAVATV
ncbi:MAG: DHH family phosphoesterase [Defluviitaleaceae bacterium]|nr:DHH family phosphoesterase [Defluviitaleaceae bacterium]MCL2836773.1 DHH family phosphoesterase [Defluviitaleaceae bacterium]